MIDINKALFGLAGKRLVFHSEADFQHALAWEIHQQNPSFSLRLEQPFFVDDKSIYIDIWMHNREETIGIELKYKTRLLDVRIDDEKYHLKNQSAQDCGRYDFVKDIQRLEQIHLRQKNFTGYAIFLTNDSAYWKTPSTNKTIDADFRVHEGRVIEGSLNWGDKASDGTKRNREETLILHNRYVAQWENYSKPSPTNYGEFRCLVSKVSF